MNAFGGYTCAQHGRNVILACHDPLRDGYPLLAQTPLMGNMVGRNLPTFQEDRCDLPGDYIIFDQHIGGRPSQITGCIIILLGQIVGWRGNWLFL